jgi:hypothetical protein
MVGVVENVQQPEYFKLIVNHQKKQRMRKNRMIFMRFAARWSGKHDDRRSKANFFYPNLDN